MLGWKYLSVALLLAVPIVNGGDCGPKFKNKCHCGMAEYIDRIQYIVNCTNSGFTDTVVS